MSRPSYQQYLRVSRSSEVFMAVGQHQAGTGGAQEHDNVTTGICFIDPTVSLSTTLWHFLKNVKRAGVQEPKKVVTANRTANQAYPKRCANTAKRELQNIVDRPHAFPFFNI